MNFHPLLGLILVNSNNLHLEELFAPHSHANDHGPALFIGPLSFFQTDGTRRGRAFAPARRPLLLSQSAARGGTRAPR